jgi:hypothetical protein
MHTAAGGCTGLCELPASPQATNVSRGHVEHTHWHADTPRSRLLPTVQQAWYVTYAACAKYCPLLLLLRGDWQQARVKRVGNMWKCAAVSDGT